LTQFDNHLIN